ncbi:aminoglycoside 3-N-acetyltransferase (plasmid) [Escherichia coli]|nr:aminoglycoside 3-N-acetyltransferase [Escherichia coli]
MPHLKRLVRSKESGDGRCRVTLRGWADWHCDGIRVVGRSPYEETLNGARLDDEARRTGCRSIPQQPDLRGFGLLNQFLVQAPGARRSAHPDASMVAVVRWLKRLTEPHELGHALGEGSPVERFVRLGGRPAVGCAAKLRYRIALRRGGCRYPNKRWVTYEMPMLGRDGEVAWKTASDYDSNGILDCFAIEGKPDAVETIANAYVKLGRHREVSWLLLSATCSTRRTS